MKKNSIYKIGSLIILLICAFVFVILPVFTGSEGRSAEKNRLSFGKYNGKEIRFEKGSDFAYYVSEYAQRIQSRGQQIDENMHYYIFNAAFKTAVIKQACMDEVDASGYKTPKSAVNRQLLNNSAYMDESGKFSSKIYKATPDSDKLSIQERVETNLRASRLQNDIFGSDLEIVGQEELYGVKESDSELDFLDSFGNKKRGFNMVVFHLSDYPAEEKINFAKANESKFVSHDFSVITLKDKAKANTVAKKLAAASITFDDAVSEYSTKDFSNTEGKLVSSLQYQIENLLANKDDFAKIENLDINSYSEVIETTEGFSIFRKNAESVKPDYNNPDTINAISSYLNSFERSKIEDYYTSIAKDFTAAATTTSFDSACSKFNTTKIQIKPFPINYESVSVATSVDTTLDGLSNADSNENFLKTAFSIKKNEISSPVIMNNCVILLQCTSEENEKIESSSAVTQITDFDRDAFENAVMTGGKLENNFATVYFNSIMGLNN